MANMAMTKVPMPTQDGNVRRNNFDEVALGYTKEMAMEEAQRCLHCPTKPCISGCPVAVNIPDFIEEVKMENLKSVSDHPPDKFFTCCLRTCLSTGNTV